MTKNYKVEINQETNAFLKKHSLEENKTNVGIC